MRALGYPFQFIPKGLSSTTSYETIVRAQVIDALMTNSGERVMRPRYGCDIQAALFDPTDELERNDAASQIETRLRDLVPRALVEGVTITAGDEGEVYINVAFRSTPYSDASTLVVPVSSSNFSTTQAALQAGST